MMRSSLATLTSIALLVLLTDCQSQPSASELAKELKVVRSWTVTARIGAQAWLENRVPTVYIKQTLQKTQESLQQEAKTITEVAPATQRETALRQVKQVESIVARMESMTEKQDRGAIARTLPELSAREAQIKTLIQQSGDKP